MVGVDIFSLVLVLGGKYILSPANILLDIVTCKFPSLLSFLKVGCWFFFCGCFGSSFFYSSCSEQGLFKLQCVGVHCSGFFCCRSRALGDAGFCICAPRLWSADSVAAAHRRCCSSACGILLGRVLNPCLLCWKMNSLSLSHQGSPWVLDFIKCFFCVFWDDHMVVFQLGWITLMYEFLFSLTFLGQMSLGHDVLSF